jgi:hypothetical protein
MKKEKEKPNGFATRIYILKFFLHEIELMGSKFDNFTRRGQAKRKKTCVTKLHEIDLEHKLCPI